MREGRVGFKCGLEGETEKRKPTNQNSLKKEERTTLSGQGSKLEEDIRGEK